MECGTKTARALAQFPFSVIKRGRTAKIERELRESLDKSVNLLKKKTSICKANCG
jgi:hypothetical protein